MAQMRCTLVLLATAWDVIPRLHVQLICRSFSSNVRSLHCHTCHLDLITQCCVLELCCLTLQLQLCCIMYMSAAISDEGSLFFVCSASCPTFFKMPLKVWMMRSWRDTFVGPTLKGSFESSISGGKLKDLINRALQADSAYMHATTAADNVFFTATVQPSPKGMITLDGTDVAFTGIVKDECH